MDISYYAIEHSEMAAYGEGYVLFKIILLALSIFIIFFFTFTLFISALHLLVKLKKIKYVSDTILGVALVLSFIITSFTGYTIINDTHKTTYLVIYYENPEQEIKIQKSALISDMCSKIETGQLTSRNPMTLPPLMRRKAIKITKADETLIHEAETKFRDKVKKADEEKYKDRLEIID